MRFLSILFNPVGHLLWWVARTAGGGIDRRLGPFSGWLLAWIGVVFFAASLAVAAYELRAPVGKLAGWQERDSVRQVEGRVTAVEITKRKTMTITQEIAAEYDAGDGMRQIAGTLTEPSIDEKKPGDSIIVYIPDHGEASLRNPENPFLDAVLAAIGFGFPSIGLAFSLRFLRHRSRLRHTERPAADHAAPTEKILPPDDLVVRGRQKIMSRDERLRRVR